MCSSSSVAGTFPGCGCCRCCITNMSVPTPLSLCPPALQTRKVKLAVQKFRTDIYRVALRMRVRKAGWCAAEQGGASARRHALPALPLRLQCRRAFAKRLQTCGTIRFTHPPHCLPTHLLSPRSTLLVPT